jgi:hypothetical protein
VPRAILTEVPRAILTVIQVAVERTPQHKTNKQTSPHAKLDHFSCTVSALFVCSFASRLLTANDTAVSRWCERRYTVHCTQRTRQGEEKGDISLKLHNKTVMLLQV